MGRRKLRRGKEWRYDYQGNSMRKIPAGGRERRRECGADTEEKEHGRGRKRKGVGGQKETEERRGEDRMNANREPKPSTEALSFTGGGATIANTFSLAPALREIKKQFVFYSYSASLGLFLCLHICKHSFVRAA